MDKEQIIQMARDAGIVTRFAKMGAGSVFWTEGVDGIVADQLYKFASYIRAATKEEDAKICEGCDDSDWFGGASWAARAIRSSK